MRWKLFFLAVVTVAVGVYAATPFRAAWVLLEAVREADYPTIERKVDWDSVRASLKDSLAEHALLLKKATAAGQEVQPTVWQRIKWAMGATMLDRFLETYLSPEGLPLLAQVRGVPDEARWGSAERFVRLVGHAKRIRFSSLTRIEFEVADEHIPDRRYAAAMALSNYEWKLVSLRVVGVEDDGSLLARR